MPAILYLWNKREYGKLELLWWKTNDPIKRLTVLACYYSQTEPAGDFRQSELWPRFKEYCKRFNASESKRRMDELEYIKNRMEMKLD